VLQVLSEYEEHRLKENIRERKNLFLAKVAYSFDAFETGIRTLTDVLKQHGEVICTLPTPGTGDGIGFTLMVGTVESQASLAAVLPAPGVALETVPISEAARQAEARPAAATLKTAGNTVRVDIQKLDSLMAAVGELHIVKGEIGRIAADLRGQQGFTGLAVNS